MVTQGSVLDLALDIRKNSSTFGHYVSEILTAEKQNRLDTSGFAHGYLALETHSFYLFCL